MAKNGGWLRVDRWMRSLHLYTGVFLAPWMLVYAASAFCLNHHHWMTSTFQVMPPKWEVVREMDFVPDASFPKAPVEQAKVLLRELGLDGAHRVQEKPGSRELVIMRISGSGNFRVTWQPGGSRLVAEQQRPFSFFRLVNFLHLRGGYDMPYLAFRAWAVIVDTVAVSLAFWVVSGIYLWARRPRKRLLGGICLIAGSLLFMGLVVMLCS